jgi:hypothetical protein
MNHEDEACCVGECDPSRCSAKTAWVRSIVSSSSSLPPFFFFDDFFSFGDAGGFSPRLAERGFEPKKEKMESRRGLLAGDVPCLDGLKRYNRSNK